MSTTNNLPNHKTLDEYEANPEYQATKQAVTEAYKNADKVFHEFCRKYPITDRSYCLIPGTYEIGTVPKIRLGP